MKKTCCVGCFAHPLLPDCLPRLNIRHHLIAAKPRGCAVSRSRNFANLDVTYRALLPTLTDDDLKRQFPAQWTTSTYETTLRYLLRETAEHMQIHAAEARAWREREHGGK